MSCKDTLQMGWIKTAFICVKINLSRSMRFRHCMHCQVTKIQASRYKYVDSQEPHTQKTDEVEDPDQKTLARSYKGGIQCTCKNRNLMRWSIYKP